jgi:hypothetical protein
MSDDEHTKLFNEALRVSTAGMLGLNISNLTAAQSVKLERACFLRLLVDDLRAKQLSGQQIDVREFVAASESLERMVGGGSLEGPARFGPDHRAKLQALIENAMRGSEEQDAEDEASRLWKDEQMALAAALPDGSSSASAQRGGSDNNVVPLDASERVKPPPHYLRDEQPREAWRDGAVTGGPYPWPLPR